MSHSDTIQLPVYLTPTQLDAVICYLRGDTDLNENVRAAFYAMRTTWNNNQPLIAQMTAQALRSARSQP